jgi:hypothetical protein
MNLEDEIIIALSYESTKDVWRNNHNSEEFRFIKQLGFTIGSPITNEKGCRCIERFFLLAKAYSRDNEKINLKQKQMNNEFKIKENKIINVAGTHYSNANITDERAIEILTKYPTQIGSFVSYPSNWEELCNVEEVSERELELKELDLPELFAIAQEIADADEDLKMVGARSKEKKVIAFIIANEK